MANLNETDQWEPGVYQLEEDDPVLGGPTGVDNRAPRELANRTRYQRLRNVTPWDATLTYPSNVAYVSYGGKTWKSVGESFNVIPGANPEKWVRWGFTATELNASVGDAVAAHEAKLNPHPQYARGADLENHVEAENPHGQYVRHDAEQILSGEQESIARRNINVGPGGNVTTVTTAGVNVLTVDMAGLVLVDATAGNIALSLPSANTLKALCYSVRRTDSSAHTVMIHRAGGGAGTDTIEGLASIGLSGGGDAALLIADGVSKWHLETGQTIVKNYGTTAYQVNAIAQYRNVDGSRSTNMYQQSAAGAAGTSVFERRNAAGTPLAQVVLGDNSVMFTDTSPTTSQTFQAKIAGNQAGLRFDNIANSAGANNVAFGWTTASVLALRIDGSNVGTLTPSDQRLKTDIKALPYGLPAIREIGPAVAFKYDQTKSKIGFRPGWRFGWIAQRVQQTLPEVVHEWTIDNENPEETTFLELDQEQLVPILWNALIRLADEVDKLKAAAP